MMRRAVRPVKERIMEHAMPRTVAALVVLGVAGCERGDGAEPSAAPSTPAPGAAAMPTGSAREYRIGALEIDNVVAAAPVPAGGGAAPVAVYFLVMNTGARSDTLDAVEIAGASATVHDPVRAANGRTSMVQVEAAAIPAGEMVRFIPGGRHVMVEGLARRVAPGDSLPLTLVFRHAGRAAVSARTVAYRDLDAAIASGADAHAGH